MANINTALDASKDAMEQLIIAGERIRTDWTSPCAPGPWFTTGASRYLFLDLTPVHCVSICSRGVH